MDVWVLGAKFQGISLSVVHGSNYQPFDGFKPNILVNLFEKYEQ